MRDTQIGSTLRALRLRRGWRQADVSARAAVARSVISSLEAGNLGRHTLDALRRSVEVCGGALQIAVRVPGGDVMRLLDADHALLQSYWAHSLRRYGWLVEAEVTFNHYGERGSLDLLAWQPARRLLLVIEVKTVIVDAQELLAGIDRKARIAAVIARERGWRPVAVIPAVSCSTDLPRDAGWPSTPPCSVASICAVGPRGPGFADPRAWSLCRRAY